MGNPYEFSNNQWHRRCWSAFWRWITGTWPWHPVKETSLPAQRYTAQDKVIPGSEGPVDTPPPDVILGSAGKIGLPAPYGGNNCHHVHLPGTPYQVGNSRTHGWKELTHFNLEYGDNKTIRFPAPKDYAGAWHREGAPFSYPRNNRAADLVWRLVDDIQNIVNARATQFLLGSSVTPDIAQVIDATEHQLLVPLGL